MTINFAAPQTAELKPRIVVIGVGGAGGNAVNNMIRSGLEGVEFVVANTDAQALAQSKSERLIQLGKSITQGLGCGARPEIGRQAAEEAIEQILDHLQGTHMVFITAGMGGGTGTGAAPVIAEACREQDILTVGVVTKPFQFEGTHRLHIAEQGIEELQKYVDTLIVIPNQNLFRVANEKTTFADAFAMADQVLHSGVRGITDLMVMPGLINLDFADVKTVMSEMGKAMMGTGEAEGDKRAVEAAEAAISNPLLDDVSMKGARGVLINISGGMDLTLFEVDEAANRIRQEVDPDANIIVGSALDEDLNGRMRVSVVATGIEAEESVSRPPLAPVRLRAVGGGDPRGGQSGRAEEQQAEPLVVQHVVEGAAVNVSMATGTDGGAARADWRTGSFAAASRKPARALDVGSGAQAAAVQAEAEPTPGPESVEPEAASAPEPATVPAPKPLSPERDLLRQQQPAQPAAESEEGFVMPKPVLPRAKAAPLGRPDPMAEADVVNAGAQADTRQSRSRSLFARMTGNARAATGAFTAKEPAKPEAGAQGRAEPAAARPRLDVTPEDRLGGPRQQDDLLEIPSFLRRQAN